MEEEIRICDCCSAEIDEYNGTWVGDDFLCHDCIDDECVTCDHCGDVIYNDDSVQDNNICLCENCYQDYYHRCDCCGRIIHDDDINWHNDYPYCDNCYDGFDDEIEEYSYKPEAIFYGDSYIYFGVELEVDKGEKDGENARV